MEYDPTQFRGTARYYLRGRPAYSTELATAVAAELNLDGRGRLLDVGCGPGTVGVELAHLFEHVTFVDPDADMLAEARAHAAGAGLTAVDFVQATAESIGTLGLPPMRVVAFGQSFHRTDRVRVADSVYDLLEPGGSMVLVNHDPTRPVPPRPADCVPIPHDEINQLLREFLGPERRSGARLASSYSDEPFDETLARTRFGSSRVRYVAGRPDIIQDAADVIANYLSMSFAAPPLFGPRFDEFVAALRALLGRHAPNGRFWDWPGDTALIIATRGEQRVIR